MSRLGVTRPVDFTVAADEDIYRAFTIERERVLREFGVDVSCLLVDEAQFLTEGQVDDLLRIAIQEDVPVLAYGIRTDFQTVAFPGQSPAARDRALARGTQDDLPLRAQGDVQRASRRRRVRLRRRPGRDSTLRRSDVTYESLCGACYLEESGGILNNGWRPKVDFSYTGGPDPDFS